MIYRTIQGNKKYGVPHIYHRVAYKNLSEPYTYIIENCETKKCGWI